jgi:DNA-binding transcriptional regulator YhcF (GntR family)
MIYGLGPRARRVYAVLRDRIARGDWPADSRLPSHRDLATEFGVAPLTVRQVLGQLEADGLVSREVGRGTFVREATTPAILVVGTDATTCVFLAEYVGRAGYRALTVGECAEALDVVGRDRSIVMVLCDLDGSRKPYSTDAIRALRSRAPHLPVVAVVAELGDLQALFGTAEWPLHVIPKPVHLGLLDELLRLVARRPGSAP